MIILSKKGQGFVNYFYKWLVFHVNDRAKHGEVIDPLSIVDRHVHTAMTHRGTEVIMPVSTVNGVALIEVEDIWHVREIISGTSHIIIAVFGEDKEYAFDRGGLPCACGDGK